MIKHNDTSLCTNYIKSFLKSFNLPSIEVLKPGMRVYAGCFYLKENTIVKALSNGIYENVNFKLISDTYTYNKKIKNFTKNLVASSIDYDFYTHEYLGEYLRFYKDFYDIDLMSLYNCFSGRSITNVTILTSGGLNLLSSSKKCTTYLIKVNPYKEYTFFVDCPHSIEIVAGYVVNDKVEDIFKDSSFKFPYESTYMKVTDAHFNKPFIYDKLTSENLSSEEWENVLTAESYNKRDCLYLIVNIPNEAKESSIVVLEGNYLDNTKKHFNNINLDLMDIKTASEDTTKGTMKYLSKLGISFVNTGSWIPFSNRLVEYLFSNAIVPNDEIDNNISKVQDILVSREKEDVRLDSVHLQGVWSEDMRRVLYAIAKNKNIINSKNDILGYVDKDIETMIVMEE